MSRNSEVIELHGVVGNETDKAIRFTPDGGDPIWLPLSQVKEIHRTEGSIVVTAWIAQQKGLA